MDLSPFQIKIHMGRKNAAHNTAVSGSTLLLRKTFQKSHTLEKKKLKLNYLFIWSQQNRGAGRYGLQSVPLFCRIS